MRRAGIAALGLLGALAACSDAARGTAAGASVPAAGAEGRAGPVVAPPRAAVSAVVAADDTAALRDELLRQIGSAACREDSQCRTLALGSKPCGGPEAYVAWSTAISDGARLEALAARYQDARSARNQRLGLISDCAVVAEPPVRCVPDAGSALGGRCQVQSGRRGPPQLTR